MRVDCTNPAAQMVGVTLDGVALTKVIWADAEAGTLSRYQTDGNDRLIVQDGHFVSEQLSGVVRYYIRYGLQDLEGYLVGFPEIGNYLIEAPPGL